MSKKETTAAPVKAGDLTGAEPEFVRVPDVQKRAGIKRGLTYRKIADGTFKSVLLREPGNKAGIRLVFWPSVRDYLFRLMEQQQAAQRGQTAARSHSNGKATR